MKPTTLTSTSTDWRDTAGLIMFGVPFAVILLSAAIGAVGILSAVLRAIAAMVSP